MIFRKSKLGLLVLAPVVLGCLVFGYSFWVNFIVKTPTCVHYSYDYQSQGFSQVASDMDRYLLAQRGMKHGNKATDRVWESASVSVSANPGASPHDGSIWVCTKDETSMEWQAIAAGIEGIVAKAAQIYQATVQLNSTVYQCNPSCAIDMPPPVDFSILNSRHPKASSLGTAVQRK